MSNNNKKWLKWVRWDGVALKTKPGSVDQYIWWDRDVVPGTIVWFNPQTKPAPRLVRHEGHLFVFVRNRFRHVPLWLAWIILRFRPRMNNLDAKCAQTGIVGQYHI